MGDFKLFRATKISTNEPAITIYDKHISFNKAFANEAELSKFKYVEYRVDAEDKRVAFKFYERSDEEGARFKLVPKTNNKNTSGYRAAAAELMTKYFWINPPNIDNERKRFTKAVYDNHLKVWVAHFQPIFELRFSYQNKNEIPRDAVGIYKYLNREGEVIYIGRGRIYERIKEKSCDEWGIVEVFYSVLNSESEQVQWERYYLNKFKTDNNSLPKYNKQLG
ncbi:MAG TPA: hypothetical protein VF609_15605 [Flavisolibacter sp.]|jgi:hypothetical protein